MGQFALGIRSLVVKSAVFVALAALLAWILGGTLFPRAELSEGPAVAWDGATWRLRLAVGGQHPGQARWSLLRQEGSKRAEPWVLAGFDEWSEAAGPVATPQRLYVAFRDRDASSWTLAAIDRDGFDTSAWPDRLEVERQLARLKNGLPPQLPAEAAAAREAVLRAGSERLGLRPGDGSSEAP